jgi:hypothetical protein
MSSIPVKVVRRNSQPSEQAYQGEPRNVIVVRRGEDKLGVMLAQRYAERLAAPRRPTAYELSLLEQVDDPNSPDAD